MKGLPTVAGSDGSKVAAIYLRQPGDDKGQQDKMLDYKIITICLLLAPAVLPAQDVDGLKKRVIELEQKLKDAEVDKLKLRLNLADEKLVNQRFEFNMLITERGRICNELGATDQKTHSERCTEKK